MRYCPDCGTGHECTAGDSSAADREVKIARINRDADVEIARIQASQTRAELDTAETIAETEAVAEVAATEAVADAIAGTPPPVEDEPPVIVETAEAEPEPEPGPDVPPPPAEPTEPAADGERGRGWWDAYRQQVRCNWGMIAGALIGFIIVLIVPGQPYWAGGADVLAGAVFGGVVHILLDRFLPS